MNERNVLKAGTILPFPGMECEIDSVVGCGSNAIVYCGHYHDQQNGRLVHQVLVKELFPYDPNGKIYRDQQGNICVEPEAQDAMEQHRFSFIRGNEIHIRLLMQHPGEIDTNINTFEWNHTLYSMLGFSGGRSLEKELQSGKNHSLQGLVKWIREALEVLEAFHTSGYLHLDISPDNILLIGQGKKERVTLIDYNSVHTLAEIREGDFVYYSAKEGYTAPEIRGKKKREIGFWSDLYAMTAVFYTCLTGEPMTVMQSVWKSVPDISGAECLQGCPSTVISMVRRILKKGLETIPQRRYQSAAQMLTDLEELEDRIEGKGITHWALWETGRAKVIKTIKENTALGYICEKEKLYPLRGTTESGEQVSLTDTEFLYGIENRKPLFLIGSGGMGKTTALLRMGYHQRKKYSPADPAIIYISLFDWKDSGDTYIRDRILENLRFKSQTDSMETARHELIRLLSEPIRTKRGDRPVLILLLDGVNEASGDTGPLQKEINELALLGGIQLVVTSRSEMTGFECQRIVLERLKREEVRKALAEQGILAPENMELLELLHVPMLLSMFIDTALAEKKQLRIDTKEELLSKYFDALLEKEVRRLPESSQECWGIQAAVHYVLPEIAALSRRYGRAVSDTELLKLMEECYKELGKKPLTAVFPQWIGHVSDMKMGAEDADSWYGKVILEFLWKRLGLIVREDQGNFRILHQMVEEYLVDRSVQFHKEFDFMKRKTRNWRILGISSGSALLVIMTLIGFLAYNSNMLHKLDMQQKETLKNESVQLAYASGIDLANGKRSSALQRSLAALPSKQEDRPVVPSAINSLADALYVYQESEYRPIHMIEQKNEILDFCLSEDGSSLVTLDEFGNLCLYDTKTEQERWRSKINVSDREAPALMVRILESQETVLCIENNFSSNSNAYLFSIKTGEMLWTIYLDEIECSEIKRVSSADVTENEHILALNVYSIHESEDGEWIDFYDNEDEEWIDNYDHEYVVFYDLQSGKKLIESDALPIPGDSSFADADVFLEDDSVYAALYYDYSEKMYYLVYLDVNTGKVSKTLQIKGGEGELTSCCNASLTYIPASQSLSEGIFLCISEGSKEDIWSEIQDKTSYFLFIPDGCEDGRLFDDFTRTEMMEEPLDIFAYEEDVIIISGNKLLCMDQMGNVVRSRTLSGKILYCGKAKENSGNSSLFFVYEDGRSDIIDLLSFNSLTDSANMLTDFALSSVSGNGKWGSPFCVMPESNRRRLCICEQAGDMNGLILEHPGLEGDNVSYDEIYTFPGRDGFIHMYTSFSDGTDIEESWDFAWYQITVTVYDEDGSVTDRFTIDKSYDHDFLGMSLDGDKLYFEEGVYDRSSYCMSGPEGETLNGRLYSLPTEEGLAFTVWDGTKVITWMDGQSRSIGVPYPGEYKERPYYTATYDTSGYQEDCVLGKNGLVILKEVLAADQGFHVSKYIIYSIEEERWTELNNASSVKGVPYVAVADQEKWIAIADLDNILRIYDQASDQIIKEYALDLDHRSIKKMQFLLEDRYLLIEQSGTYGTNTQPCFDIIDTQTGDLVFSYASEDGSSYSKIQTFADREQNRLYLMDYASWMTGLCIDTENWEILYTIPGLRGVLNNGTLIVQDSDNRLVQYPVYSMEDLIQMGEMELRSATGAGSLTQTALRK